MRLSAAPPAASGRRAEAPAPAPRAAPRARAPRAPPAAALPAAARAARPRSSTLARAKLQADGTYDVDALDVDSLALDDPYGVVGDVMTTGELRRATPGQSLAAAAALLDKVTGVAVVDSLETNLVLGVLSIKDVNRVRKAGTSLEVAIVDSHMSTPPIVVRARARIGEAAALMLARGIHRLPVVDGEGRLIGIVSRTDIFAPLLNQKADVYAALDAMPKEAAERIKAALRRSEKAKAREAEADARDVWTIKYLYDGDCELCQQMKRTLEGKDGGAGRVKFVNIAAVGYAPGENEGVSYDAAMSTIHAIRRDGTVVTGPVALRALYDAVGWGWVAAFMALPLVDVGVEWFYKFVAKYRLPLSGTLTAMRRVKMTDEGVEHCVDDEDECEATAW